MTNVSIIGTGLIGTSIGLALKQLHGDRFKVVGYDADEEAQVNARKMGALDNAEWNIDAAVNDADIVVISTPANAVYEILETIGPFMKPGSVVTDTVSTKETIIAWAEETLPETVSFVGGNPLIGAGFGQGQQNANALLFQEKRYVIAPTPRAAEDAVRAVVEFAEALEAKPLFMDPGEHDSFAAAMTALPMLSAATIMDAVSSSPSWRELARFASTDFFAVTQPTSTDPAVSHGVAATNPDMVIYWLDELMSRLRKIRDSIVDEDARFDVDGPLASTLINAWEARARLDAGVVSDDRPDDNSVPSASEGMLSLFMGNRAAKFLSGPGRQEKDPTKYDRKRMN